MGGLDSSDEIQDSKPPQNRELHRRRCQGALHSHRERRPGAQGAAANLARLPASPRALYLLEGIVRFADSLRDAAPSSLIWSYQPHPELGHGTIYRARSAAAITAITAITARPATVPCAAAACAARRFE